MWLRLCRGEGERREIVDQQRALKTLPREFGFRQLPVPVRETDLAGGNGAGNGNRGRGRALCGIELVEIAVQHIFEIRRLGLDVRPVIDVPLRARLARNRETRMRSADIAHENALVAHGLILRAASVTCAVSAGCAEDSPTVTA
jgi:hypothetical protein